MAQFESAKDFANAVSTSLGRSYLVDLNKRSGESRLRVLVDRIEHLYRYDESNIYFSYNNAAYGLNRVIVTGRTNGIANRVIHAMNVRQMCELVYELAQYSSNIEMYGAYLNQKYTPARMTGVRG